MRALWYLVAPVRGGDPDHVRDGVDDLLEEFFGLRGLASCVVHWCGPGRSPPGVRRAGVGAYTLRYIRAGGGPREWGASIAGAVPA